MGKSSGIRIILSIIGGGSALAKLLVSLLLIWLTLGWQVRKAKKAFEKELIRGGIAKHDAKRIGAQYTALKDDVEEAFKQSLRRRR